MWMHLAQGQDNESSSTAGIHNHGHKLGVDRAEVAVPGHLGDPNVIIALVGLQRLAKNMAELTGPDHLPRHDDLRKDREGRDTEMERKQSTHMRNNNKVFTSLRCRLHDLLNLSHFSFLRFSYL